MAPDSSSPPLTRSPWDSRDDFLLLPSDGMILVNGEGRITSFDHKARQLMPPGSVLRCGEPLSDSWPELAEALEEHSDAVCRLGPLETQVVRGDGQQSVRLFRLDEGVGIVLPSGRPEARGAGREQLLMHQRILRHIRDAVIVTTAEPLTAPGPVIVYANRAAQRQTGYSLTEMLGRSPRLFHGPETDPAALLTFHTALRQWQPVRQRVLNYRRNGTSFWVEIDIAPLADSDGWYTYWVSVQREIPAPAAPAPAPLPAPAAAAAGRLGDTGDAQTWSTTPLRSDPWA